MTEENKAILNSLREQLNQLLKVANGGPLTIRSIIDILAKRGQAVLLILLSLPFCLPIQIPGFSTPFGILLAFIGLRVAFGRHVWLPKIIQEKEISFATLKKIASFAISVTDKFQFLIRTRMVWLVKNPASKIMNGLTIFFLALFLSLPLPIPFSNMIAAVPILAFGLAILEDDGVFIIVAYFLTLMFFLAIFALFWFGKEWFIAMREHL